MLQSNSKILNALDFPMWKDPQWDRSSYATDMVAWDRLRGTPYCGHITTHYPTEHMRWGLAGTAHTFTSLHIDSDGFATFIQIMCGMKVWAVYRPSSVFPLSSMNVFTHADSFEPDKMPNDAQFGLEAVVLKPGDQLYVCSLYVYLHYIIFFVQVNAAWCSPLRVWDQGHDNSWGTFLLFVSNASNCREPGTHLRYW
jgi:hypothetical protein